MDTDRAFHLDCIICQKQSGRLPLPGGALYQDGLVFACHAHPTPDRPAVYLGWLSVETTRHISGLADLTEAEGQALGGLVARLSRVLKAVTGAEQLYAFVIGHGAPHLHVHLLPRYPGTPREYWGVRVDEWQDAPHGGVEEIAGLCKRIREAL